MPAPTKPYTFTAGEPAVAAYVNADFDTLYAYIATGNIILADASVAFTATPTGPALDPFSPNDLVRKAYVDNNFLKDFVGGSGLSGNPISGTPMILTAGSYVATMNGAGAGGVNFETPFPNGILTVVACSGDDTLVGVVVDIIAGQCTTNNFGFQCSQNGNVLAGDVLRTNWIAIGW